MKKTILFNRIDLFSTNWERCWGGRCWWSKNHGWKIENFDKGISLMKKPLLANDFRPPLWYLTYFLLHLTSAWTAVTEKTSNLKTSEVDQTLSEIWRKNSKIDDYFESHPMRVDFYQVLNFYTCLPFLFQKPIWFNMANNYPIYFSLVPSASNIHGLCKSPRCSICICICDLLLKKWRFIAMLYAMK